MTEKEAISELSFHCIGFDGKPKDIDNFLTAVQCGINALEEIQQYREIGTVEDFRKAKRFKEYFDELYGTGLEVANWHKNGDTEPFDNFYDAAIDWSEEE